MPFDLLIVLGLLTLAFGILACLSAFADQRRPVFGPLLLLAGAVLVGMAVAQHPGPGLLTDIPAAFIQVAARIVN